MKGRKKGEDEAEILSLSFLVISNSLQKYDTLYMIVIILIEIKLKLKK